MHSKAAKATLGVENSWSVERLPPKRKPDRLIPSQSDSNVRVFHKIFSFSTPFPRFFEIFMVRTLPRFSLYR